MTNGVDRSERLTDYGLVPHSMRVELLIALQRQRAELDAREQRLLQVMAADPVPGIDGDPAVDKQWVREDVACAMRVSGAVAQSKLHTATELVERLPFALAALRDGRLSLAHCRRLVEAVRPLPDQAAAKVEARVLARAHRQTVTQFSACVRRAVVAADPRQAEDRHLDARAGRRVVFTAQDDGMTELWALLPAEGATALQARIQQRAGSGEGGDGRCVDQRRADALVDLALVDLAVGGLDGPGGPRPMVQVTVALSTLLGVDDQPAELDGHGPVPAALARRLADDPSGTWRRLVTGPCGQVINAGRRRYRPPAALARHVRTAYRSCRFPGCTRAAARCEVDHITAWEEGGETCEANLQPLCPRHHHLKHDTAWQVRRLPDGTTRWRSPSGHTHDRPPDDPLPLDRTINPEPSAERTDADAARLTDAPPF